jgi:hypothetical protein
VPLSALWQNLRNQKHIQTSLNKLPGHCRKVGGYVKIVIFRLNRASRGPRKDEVEIMSELRNDLASAMRSIAKDWKKASGPDNL